MEPLQSPDFACSSCGTRLSSSRAVTASVLYPHGWEQRQHRSKRCLKSSCSLFCKRVWHNYLADKNGHWFHWRSPQAMEYFFLSHTWCVSTSWLRQISRRLVCFSLQEMVNFFAYIAVEKSVSFYLFHVSLIELQHKQAFLHDVVP